MCMSGTDYNDYYTTVCGTAAVHGGGRQMADAMQNAMLCGLGVCVRERVSACARVCVRVCVCPCVRACAGVGAGDTEKNTE